MKRPANCASTQWCNRDGLDGRIWRITPMLMDGQVYFTLAYSDFGLVPSELKRVGFPTPALAARKVRELQEERNRCYEERWTKMTVGTLG